jgi:hypothetical protein
VSGSGNQRSANYQEFVSFEDAYNDAVAELSDSSKTESLQKLLIKHSDVIVLDIDSTIRPTIPYSVYMKICNREKIYQTQEFVNKVIGYYVVSTSVENVHLLKSLDSIEGLVKAPLKTVAIKNRV